MEQRGQGQPHPRRQPRLSQPMTREGLEQVFRDCADFRSRELRVGGDPGCTVILCYIEGMARNERVSDYVLRPLAQDRSLRGLDQGELIRAVLEGALYNISAQERTTTDQVAADLVIGCAALLFPREGRVVTLFTGTEEKRSIGQPESEPSAKGARDSFVESLRTNTSMVRRRLRAPELRIREFVVGRQSLTPVDVVWLEGIASPEVVSRIERQLEAMDVDGIRSTASLEEYLVCRPATPFPMTACTQRPDRFCGGLLEGRVGVLCEGQAVGWLLPATLAMFFRTEQDRTSGWMTATALRVLRWLCMLTTLLLPGLYVAAVTFHPEMIPVKLAASIAAAKREVPFSTVVEVLIMLIAFEVVQEAGLRLPGPIGQTVSILGGLVVGSAAVEARIVSPAVLIVVAAAGIAGYAVPGQDLAGALRLCRFVLAVLASLTGMFGLVMGGAALIIHLAGLESFAVAYLAPFTMAPGEGWRSPAVVRWPLQWVKLRQAALRPGNRRKQK